MTRQRANAPTVNPRRVRAGGPVEVAPGARVRRRGTTAPSTELSEDEVRALLDDDVDPEDVVRISRDHPEDTQEASDHDRDTTRDRLEGLRLDAGR